MEQYISEVAEKTSAMTDLEGQIETQKAEISRILSKRNASSKELSQARTLIASLRNSTDDYKKQIEALTFQNQQLTSENTGLKTSISEKEQAILEKESNIATLETEKTELATMKLALSEQKAINLTKRLSADQSCKLQTSAVRLLM